MVQAYDYIKLINFYNYNYLKHFPIHDRIQFINIVRGLEVQIENVGGGGVIN